MFAKWNAVKADDNDGAGEGDRPPAEEERP